jgi:hypothetical protein
MQYTVPRWSEVANWLEGGGYLPLLGLLAALGLLYAGVRSLQDEWRWRAAAAETTGVVDGIDTHLQKPRPNATPSEARREWTVRAHFVVEGAEYRVSHQQAGLAPQLAVGESVKVRYLPRNPDQARLANASDTFQRLVVPLGMAVGGLVGTGAAIWTGLASLHSLFSR